MKLTYDLFIEQQQKLMMTPELRQAIAILQMSTLELGEYVQKEMEENPLLEEIEPEENSSETNEYDKENDEDISNQKTEEWLEYFNDRDIGIVQKKEEEKTFDSYTSRRPSLYEHLQFQWRLACTDDNDLMIGNYIIGCIDPNGYLSDTVEEIAANTNASEEKIEELLNIIQLFHPHGVGARDLTECLLIQLIHYGKDDTNTIRIVEEYLNDLAKGRLNKIASNLGISVCEVQGICDFIRTLDPKPGLQYSNVDDVRYIISDVIVEKVEGKYIVVVNDARSPRLIVNKLYENMMRKPDAFSNDAQKYLEEKMGSAIWLIKSIEQRRMTLYKVARCIVDIQTEFMDKGIKYLKPLNLKQVAEMVEVHESTVSRATSNKYIQTPQGLFEMKYFFSSGINSYMGNEKVSSKSIKSIIQEIIDSEDQVRPLSDQEIAQILKEKGIRISRRTVAKYRQDLGILSTVARKRYDK